MAGKKIKKLQEEEFSAPAIIAGVLAGAGASAFTGIALKNLDIPMKGPRALLKPIAIFGIAHWVANEAMMAAAEDVEETVEDVVTATVFFKEFKKNMAKIKAAKEAVNNAVTEEEFEEEDVEDEE